MGLGSKGPCTQIAYTLAVKGVPLQVLGTFGAKVYTIWAHGPLGLPEVDLGF